jgi:hypothetical protein
MTAVWYRFRAELRLRWRAWLGLGLLVGLAAGAVMALAAGARRTDSAYARFLETHDAYDVMVFDFGQPGSPGVGGFDKIRALPSVEDSAAGELGLIPLGRSHVIGLASEDGRIGTEINTFKLLEGRRADPGRVDEAVVTVTAADERNLHVGSTIPFLTPADVEAMTDPDEAAAARRFLAEAPDGRLRVVGIEASPGELPPQLEDEDEIALHLTPAFHRLHLLSLPDPPITPKVLLVELRDGADAVSAFNADLNRLSDGLSFDSVAQVDHAAVVERSIHLQAVALWLLAGLVAVSGVLIAGQLLSRLMLIEATDHATLGALGMSARDRALLGVVRAGAVGGVAALAGTVAAIAVSPVMPTGLARIAEPDPGLEVDALVVGLGAAVTVVIVTALGAWAAWRASAATRQPSASGDQGIRRRPSGVGRLVAAAGGWPLPATVGVRMALEPGRGHSAVPVRTTLAGVALGVGALVGAGRVDAVRPGRDPGRHRGRHPGPPATQCRAPPASRPGHPQDARVRAGPGSRDGGVAGDDGRGREPRGRRAPRRLARPLDLDATRRRPGRGGATAGPLAHADGPARRGADPGQCHRRRARPACRPHPSRHRPAVGVRGLA